MNAQENKQVVQEIYQLFQRGDINGMLARCHEDAEWISPELESIPFSGNFHGKQGIAEYLFKLNASMQPIRIDISEWIAEGDKVVVVGQASWQVRMTGRTLESPWVHVFTMRDGKAARVQALTNTAATEKAFRPEGMAQASTATPLHH